MSTDDDELKEAEAAVLEAAGLGTTVDLRVGESDQDDPAHGTAWDTARTVRAALLVALLTGERVPGTGRLRMVKLRGARITGDLDLEAASIGCPLVLEDCYIDEPVNLSDATAAVIRMPGCRLPVLFAKQLRTSGNLELNRKFCAYEGVNLAAARIGGQLDLSTASLRTPRRDGYALIADGLSVDHDMVAYGATFDGAISLVGAHIGGRLALSAATISGRQVSPVFPESSYFAPRHESAFEGDTLTVDQDMLCDDFKASGEIRLTGARVGGKMSFEYARLTNPDGMSLHAHDLTVDQGMYCQRDFSAEGEICLERAAIHGALSFRDATLSPSYGKCLTLAGMSSDMLHLTPQAAPQGLVDLANARVGAFYDDQATWPREINLREFAYSTLENKGPGVRERLQWLRLDPNGYAPQIYNQLAAVYQRAGNETAARKVAIAKQRRRRSTLNPAARLANVITDVTVGYGYNTWKAGVWLVVLAAFGTATFGSIHMIAEVSRPPAFNSPEYSLDLLIPIADLGQKNDWQPVGVYLYLALLLRGVGWILTTAVVAAITGVLKRD